MKFYFSGDTSMTIDFGASIGPETNDRVWSAYYSLRKHPFPGMKDLVGAYHTLTVHYDPWVVKSRSHLKGSTTSQVQDWVSSTLGQQSETNSVGKGNLFRIPVCYGEEFGPDLGSVSSSLGIPKDKVIQLHSSINFRIYMIGFLPGFVYLGNLPDSMRLPRKQAPSNMKKGSVALASWQTGIYPSDSPGGWHCIGRTPIELFSLVDPEPMLWKPGDQIRFVPIDASLFSDIESGSKWEF